MPLRYVIVGGGLAGASAIEGIRSRDRESEILLISRENHPPYHRPPLSKGLWFGKETLDQVPVHDDAWYREHRGWWEPIKSGEWEDYYRRQYEARLSDEGRPVPAS